MYRTCRKDENICSTLKQESSDVRKKNERGD